jgi:hypothetical protein
MQTAVFAENASVIASELTIMGNKPLHFEFHNTWVLTILYDIQYNAPHGNK